MKEKKNDGTKDKSNQSSSRNYRSSSNFYAQLDECSIESVAALEATAQPQEERRRRGDNKKRNKNKKEERKKDRHCQVIVNTTTNCAACTTAPIYFISTI